MQPKRISQADERDPRRHVRNVENRFQELIDTLRDDIENIDEPRCKAMFETAAEVLVGLKKAFYDYQRKNEAAWR